MRKYLFFSMLIALASFAAVPQQINYSGNLTSPSGIPLDTTVQIVFKLYTDSTAGTLLWTEIRPSVAVTKGVFNIRLGQLTALTDGIINQSQLWLGLTVGADVEMTPRTRIVSVPYAYRVGTVDGASGGIISDKINVGSGNTNSGAFATVFGENNIVTGTNAFIGGGKYNRARGQLSVVAGGGGLVAADSNSASGIYSTISGGVGNTASNNTSTIGGGYNNICAGSTSVIAGGSFNEIYSTLAAICGGTNNSVEGYGSFVGGGEGNIDSSYYGALGGGYYNTVYGQYSTVPGGLANSAWGENSFAAGAYAKALHSSAFVWSSGSDSTLSFGNSTFTARAEGGVRFYTASTGTSTGVRVLAGGGSWASLCDSTAKRRYGKVNTKDILDKVATLPIERWSYKTQDEKIQHIGPMAQDFYKSFQIGDDETTINTVDPDGIALAAIQELAKENQDLRKELAQQAGRYDKELNELRAQVQSLLADKKLTMK